MGKNKQWRVLQLDDSPEFLRMVKHLLETNVNGLTVTSETNGDRALELVQSEQFDAILVDYIMPKFSGLEFVKTLRSRGNWTPVALITAYGNREDTPLKALNTGANFYIEKETDFTSTLEQIKRFLNNISTYQVTTTEVTKEESKEVKTFEEDVGDRLELGQTIEQFVWEVANKIDVPSTPAGARDLGLSILEVTDELGQLNEVVERSYGRTIYFFDKVHEELSKLTKNLQETFFQPNDDESDEESHEFNVSNSIMKNLWIVETGGLCLFNYQAPGDEIDLDPLFFGGMVSALASFTDSLSSRTVEFIKMQDDTIFFISMDNIIVASILRGFRWIEVDVVVKYLRFFGKHFTISYGQYMEQGPMADWSKISKQLKLEVEKILTDKALYEVFKLEIINNLLNDLISKKKPPEALYWKIIELMSGMTPNEVEATFQIVKEMVAVNEQNIVDKTLANQIQEIVNKTEQQLRLNLSDEMSEMLVLADDSELFKNLLNNFLFYASLVTSYIKGVKKLDSKMSKVSSPDPNEE